MGESRALSSSRRCEKTFSITLPCSCLKNSSRSIGPSFFWGRGKALDEEEELAAVARDSSRVLLRIDLRRICLVLLLKQGVLVLDPLASGNGLRTPNCLGSSTAPL